MPNDLYRITPILKHGNEPLHATGKSFGILLLDFRRWNASDLVSNATRGILAEFIVASALVASDNYISTSATITLRHEVRFADMLICGMEGHRDASHRPASEEKSSFNRN